MITRVRNSFIVFASLACMFNIVFACEWCTKDRTPAFDFLRDLGMQEVPSVTGDDAFVQQLLEQSGGDVSDSQIFAKLIEMLAGTSHKTDTNTYGSEQLFPNSSFAGENEESELDGAPDARTQISQDMQIESTVSKPIQTYITDSHGDVPLENTSMDDVGVAASDSRDTSFSREYIERYFPRARRIMHEYFVGMCPRAIDRALGTILDILATQDTQWFYFQNTPEHFRAGERWESVADQCELLHSFLDNAQVQEDSTVVCYHEQKSILFPLRHTTGTVSLLDAFRAAGLHNHERFYALYFDYVTKLFNEAIQFLDKKTAYSMKYDLVRILKKLKNTLYDARAAEVVRTSAQLYENLTSRLRAAQRDA